MMSSEVGGGGDNLQNSTVMRTNSTFDTHIMVQQREKYFDRIGVDGGSGGTNFTPQ